MQTGKIFLPSSRICLPSAWKTVPTYFRSDTRYCSAMSLDIRFTPQSVSTTAFCSAPPISAFTSIDRSLLSPTEVVSEDPGRFRKKTCDTLLAGAVLAGFYSRPGRSSFNCSFLLDSFEYNAFSHGAHITQCLVLPSRSFLVADVLLPGNHFS